MNDEENPLESLHSVMVHSARDQGLCGEDAWAYGIIVGWGDALDEVASQHGWNMKARERLRRLHAAFQGLRDHDPKGGPPIPLGTADAMRDAIRDMGLAPLFKGITGRTHAKARKDQLSAFWVLLQRGQCLPRIDVAVKGEE
jgi:hypothetical protein